MKSLLRASLFALSLFPLQAQSRFGLEIGNPTPLGNLRDSLGRTRDEEVGGTLGATFRLHTFKDRGTGKGLPGDLALRLRASAVAYPEPSQVGRGLDISGTSLNLEVVHTFGADLTGFQVLSGCGLVRWELRSTAGTRTTERPVTTLGAGWQWRWVGVETRWSASSFSRCQSAHSVDTVVSFRFPHGIH